MSKVVAKTTKSPSRLHKCDEFFGMVHHPKKGNVVCVQKNEELKEGNAVSQPHRITLAIERAPGGLWKLLEE